MTADSAGTVSLIDLGKPAVLWLQAPFRRPVVCLALARVPLPAARDRSELMHEHATAPDGTLVRAVVAVAADSTVGVMDLATGFFISKWVVYVLGFRIRALNLNTGFFISKWVAAARRAAALLPVEPRRGAQPAGRLGRCWGR